MEHILDFSGLTYLWGKIKSLLANGTAGKAQSIPFGKVDSTSTATAFTATVEGITELKNGTCVYLMNGVVTSAAASTTPKCWTLNINNLGAKPVYVTTAEATYSTTHFTKNYKMLFTYDASLNSGNGGWYIGELFNSNVELRHNDTYDLPYDAEVEYLQSSGTQYIDTGIVASQDLYSEVDCSIDNGTSDVTILGARSGSTRIYLLHRASSAFCIGYGGYYTGGTFANNTRYLAKTSLKPNIQTLDIDGTTIIQINKSSNSTSINLYLFALNYSTKFYSNAKIWSCKIKQGDVLVRDFIPVRVGQVGYMYDKVSGQLFGNAGTGSFTFGNDIGLQQTYLYVDDTNVGTLVTSYEPSPSARPYVAPSWEALINLLYGQTTKTTCYEAEITESGKATGFVDLSAYENGKTYKITLDVKESVTLLMQTRDSNGSIVSDFAHNVSVTDGQTYTYNWTKQSSEVRLLCMTDQGKSFKYHFEISYENHTAGIIERIEAIEQSSV